MQRLFDFLRDRQTSLLLIALGFFLMMAIAGPLRMDFRLRWMTETDIPVFRCSLPDTALQLQLPPAPLPVLPMVPVVPKVAAPPS